MTKKVDSIVKVGHISLLITLLFASLLINSAQAPISYDPSAPSQIISSNRYRPRIFLSGDSYPVLNYATWTGYEWINETIPTEPGLLGALSLAFDSHGQPHVCYYVDAHFDWGFGIFYTMKTESGWTKGQLVGDSLNFPTLTLDSNDNPHIVSYYGTHYGPYNVTTGIAYSKLMGNTWTTEYK